MTISIQQAREAIEDLKRTISRTPAKDFEFPTHLNLIKQIKSVIDNDNSTIDDIKRVICCEPLVAARVVHMANSSLYIGSSSSNSVVMDIDSAITRLGTTAVRNIAYTVSVAQFIKAESTEPFSLIIQRIWKHSVCVAVAAEMLSREFGVEDSREAFFMGLVHDIGAFYFLSKASKYKVLSCNEGVLIESLRTWHTALTIILLMNLGISEEMSMSMSIFDQVLDPPPSIPSSMAELLYLANGLASHIYFWEETMERHRPLPEGYLEFVSELAKKTDNFLAEVM